MRDSRKRASPTRTKSESARVQRRKLANGLRLVLVPMAGARSATASLHVRVGSRFESARDNGISHFLEHMLHRGTTAHPSAHEQALAFERLGGTLGASTYVDHGVLAVSVPPDRICAALELLADVCLRPVFDAIETERGIVREEILETLDSRGRRVGPDDILRSIVFPRHALGMPITGELATLKRFDRPALKRHHRRYYTSRMVVVVAGRFSSADVTRSVSEHFRLPRGKEPKSPSPRQLRGPVISHVRDDSSQTALRLGFRGPGERDRDEPAVELLLRVIDDGTSTRLYHRICDERGLCYDVSALFEPYEDAGLLDIAADCSHEHTLEVATEILRMARELREQGPTEAELEKARTRLAFQLEAMHDSPAELAAFYGFGELTGLDRTPEQRLARMHALGPRELKAAARRLFRADRLGLVTVGDLDRGQRASLARAVADFA
ncbi:MAG TPA: pitrilysin family protein [Polyangiaceae bacterium]